MGGIFIKVTTKFHACKSMHEVKPPTLGVLEPLCVFLGANFALILQHIWMAQSKGDLIKGKRIKLTSPFWIFVIDLL
jgi:hypothetical protein